MKRILTVSSLVILTAIIFSCKRDALDSSNNSNTTVSNRPPVAKAGADSSVRLSCNSVQLDAFELDGSASYDDNNDIVFYRWTAIAGPSGFSIQSPNKAKTLIKNLSAGRYEFELTVRDGRGLSSNDTVIITVNKPGEYNGDIILNTRYEFYDNVFDPWQYMIDAAYFDLTAIKGKVTISPFGDFDVYVEEYADTAALSDNIYIGYVQISMGHVNPLYVSGTNSINFKKLIRQGGGKFSGSFTVTSGSAAACNPAIYLTLSPLSMEGTLDVNTHQVTLLIKGKIIF